MVSKSELAQVIEVFRSEAHELAQQIGDQVLALEKAPSAEERANAMAVACRAAHSIKGAASMVGLGMVEELVHALEDLLVAVRDHGVAPAGEVVDLVLAAVDRLNALVTNAQPGSDALAPDDARLAENLRHLAGVAPKPGPRRGDVHAGAADAPAAGNKGQPETPEEGAGADSVVRISQRKLDTLLDYIGELVEMKIRMEEIATCVRDVEADLGRLDSPELRLPRRPLQQLAANVTQEIGYLGKLLHNIQDELREVSMTPVEAIFSPLRRAVRDSSRKLGLNVELVLSGGEVELGRSIVDDLKSPLIHLLRNSIAHGIEPSDERMRAGKPAQGSVAVKVVDRGNNVLIEVHDDGRGIDFAKVFASAKRLGLYPEQAAMPPESELTRVLFVSGFTTAEQADTISGRGVGLDAVKQAVEKMRGTVVVNSVLGHGTTFSISVPLTLTSNSGLVVRIGSQRYVFPRAAVDRAISFTGRDLVQHNGRSFLVYEGHHVPVAVLDQSLKVHELSYDRESVALLVRATELAAVIVVDGIIGESEILVRDLGSFLTKVDKISGITITASGEMQFVLNPAEIVRAVFEASAPGAAPAGSAGEQAQAKTVLVVDDSVTSRAFSQKFLVACGYHVLTAADGSQALQVLATQECALVLTDIEMPQMDGFELTQRIKADERLRTVPVVILTSAATDEAKRRGLACGADAYLVKRELSQAMLLETIAQLV